MSGQAAKTNFFNFIRILVLSVLLFFVSKSEAFADEGAEAAAASAVVTTAVNQYNLYSQTLSRIDDFMSLPEQERVLMRYNNKYAYTGAGQQVFSPTFIPDEKAGVWIKSFSLFEQIPLNNGPDISNVGYGAVIGYDTDLKHCKNGWDVGLTYHAAYQGSRENFNTTSSMDSLGNAGVTVAAFKKNFFTATTASAGGDYTYENVGKGEQNFRIFIAGVASKTGYNFEFRRGKYILQPNVFGAYTYALVSHFNSYDGKNTVGDPLNAIHISPGVKLIGNFKNGLQPYLSLSVVWTIMDSPVIYKSGVLQQRVSINPYCEYGVGFQRKWKDRYTGFGQVIMRGGGRNGVSLYFGLRTTLGKDKINSNQGKT